jgi:hypothetical protein
VLVRATRVTVAPRFDYATPTVKLSHRIETEALPVVADYALTFRGPMPRNSWVSLEAKIVPAAGLTVVGALASVFDAAQTLVGLVRLIYASPRWSASYLIPDDARFGPWTVRLETTFADASTDVSALLPAFVVASG